MTLVSIEVKDKVMSPDQFRDFVADLESVALQSGVPLENLRFDAGWKGNDRVGVFSSLRLQVDDRLESEARRLLQLHGFLDRTDPGIPVLSRPAVLEAVRKYVRRIVEESEESIEWVLLYDLKNTANICLLYLSPELPVDPEAKILIHRFVPDLPVAIPGRLLVSFSSPTELDLALRKSPKQPVLSFLKSGDFEVVHGPSGRPLTSVIPWAGGSSA